MERVFIGVSRADATRKADEWWGRQKDLRQTLRTEVAVGAWGLLGKRPAASERSGPGTLVLKTYGYGPSIKLAIRSLSDSGRLYIS
jgi:hypothetical protein